MVQRQNGNYQDARQGGSKIASARVSKRVASGAPRTAMLAKAVRRVEYQALWGGLAVALLAASPAAAGYTFNTIGRFDYDPGAAPAAPVTVIGDRLYGTTGGGGILCNCSYHPHGYGTFYSLPLTGGKYTPLSVFNGFTGVAPDYQLAAIGKTLYGVALEGGYGPGFNGTIFSISISPAGTLTNLYTFDSQVGPPNGGLTAVGNKLYGVARGGAFGDGVLYSASPSGGGIQPLIAFNGFSTDLGQVGDLVASGNTLYGVSPWGGTDGYGSVYSFNLSTNTYTRLGSFNGINGANPQVGLTLGGNTLYGTTRGGGVFGHGAVFSIPITGGDITTLASMPYGVGFASKVTLVGNVLYGTLDGGGGRIPARFSLFRSPAAPECPRRSYNLTAPMERTPIPMPD